jgi:lysophospholipase L1-like esterase
VLLALFVTEAVLHLAGIRPERHRPPRWEVWDDGAFEPTTPWGAGRIRRKSSFERLGVRMGEYVPGARFRVLYGDAEDGVEMSVNALGLRGPPVERAKSPGTFRVLALGDSFTFGVGVRDEDTFVRRIEAALAKDGPAEVLNAGVQGYNTRDEVIYLEHRWGHLDPDLVLITFFLNDAYSDAAILNRGEDFDVGGEGASAVGRWSRIVEFAEHGWRVRAARSAVEEHYEAHYFDRGFLENRADDAPFRVDWDAARAALARARELADERGFTLAVAIFPELFALDGDYPFEAIHDLVREQCETLSIPVCDLLPAFRGHDAATLWVDPADHHPNAQAHRIAADGITTFLRERGLVKR